jgi:hypothetical protein
MKTTFPSFNPGPWLRFDAVALNPQPLPPRSAAKFAASPIDVATLNPQPLPPKSAGRNPLDSRALNPQPLPPREAGSELTNRISLAFAQIRLA